MKVLDLFKLLSRTDIIKYYDQEIVFKDCEGQIHDIEDDIKVHFLNVSSRHGSSEAIIEIRCTSY